MNKKSFTGEELKEQRLAKKTLTCQGLLEVILTHVDLGDELDEFKGYQIVVSIDGNDSGWYTFYTARQGAAAVAWLRSIAKVFTQAADKLEKCLEKLK